MLCYTNLGQSTGNAKAVKQADNKRNYPEIAFGNADNTFMLMYYFSREQSALKTRTLCFYMV